MSKNSFKELQEEQAEQFKDNTRKVKDRVDGSFNTIGLFTNIVELYFTRLIDLFLNMNKRSDSMGIGSNIEKDQDDE